MAPKTKRTLEEAGLEPPPTAKKTTPKPTAILTVTESPDKKDEARYFLHLTLDPIKNLRHMAKIEKFRRSIQKGKLQPTKAPQIDYLTNGGSARVSTHMLQCGLIASGCRSWADRRSMAPTSMARCFGGSSRATWRPLLQTLLLSWAWM
jgi:hypothetical protein